MASKQDIDFTYTALDRIFRLSIGEMADFSAAFYNGNFSMTLEEAQRAKHQFIADQLGIHEGSRVLEMGSGWGPFLKYITQERGAKGIGLTLSDGQYKACRKNGLEVYIKDCRKVKPEDFGTFDAVVSVGAFEHFCSPDEYSQGKQDEIYRNLFKTVSDLLPAGGKFFLQTMTFTDKIIKREAMNIHADKNSNEYLLALIEKHLPGSWLPYGQEMILRNADPFFKLNYISSGRADYIETIRVWRKMLRKFNLEKYGIYARLLFQFIWNKEFSHWLPVFRISPIKVLFERDLMEHYRMVLEKK